MPNIVIIINNGSETPVFVIRRFIAFALVINIIFHVLQANI